jgi:hypothetical protein
MIDLALDALVVLGCGFLIVRRVERALGGQRDGGSSGVACQVNVRAAPPAQQTQRQASRAELPGGGRSLWNLSGEQPCESGKRVRLRMTDERVPSSDRPASEGRQTLWRGRLRGRLAAARPRR